MSVDVVASDGTEISQQQVMFAYHVRPTIDKLLPSQGPDTGGAQVTCIGKNFLDSHNSVCMFGDAIATGVNLLSSSLVVCVSPSHSSGNVTVSFSNNGADFSASVTRYRFRETSYGAYILPSGGNVVGGTAVTIFAAVFREGERALVFFGS